MASLLGRLREALRVLRWSRREQKTALLGAACFAALPLLRQLPLAAPLLAVATWIVAGLGTVAWVLTAWRLWRYSLAPPAPKVDEGGVAIKGASAFTPDDAELFSRLGRLDELKQLRSWARDTSKVPVVAVMGESGVGKTSLLRAGLAFILGKGDEPIPHVYWEADPRDPCESFLRAVEMQLGSRDLTALPRSVLVADQLEQLDPARHPELFQLLIDHLDADPPYRVTWIVAYRREFASTWTDFLLDLPERSRHRPQLLSLRRFTVRQAQEIFATLAEHAELPVRQSLAEQVVEQIAENGTVSPVDLGITLQVLHHQPKLADDPAVFRTVGGHAGLLTFYLDMVLEAHPATVREEVFRTLLALIEEDEDRRLAEGRSVDELLEIARPGSPRHLQLALESLAQPGVRVLEPLQGGGATRYRLVHERFIPAIRRLSGEILGAADRASRLLERRFRLWQREGQRSRFLLEGRELREVLQQQSDLLWGSDRAEKADFLGRSRRRRVRQRLAAAAALAVSVAAGTWLLHEQRVGTTKTELHAWGLPQGTYEVLPRVTALAAPAVTNTRWLSRAGRLESASLAFAPQYQAGTQETLPQTLRRLDLSPGALATSRWPRLPADLEALTLHLTISEQTADWPRLPASLQSLSLSLRGPIVSWPTLPASLRELAISVSSFTLSERTAGTLWWPELPPALESLSVDSLLVPVEPWPELSPTVERISLSVDGGSLDTVRWPPALRSLELRVRGFRRDLPRELPALPPTLESLTINFDPSAAGWAAWPTHLEELIIEHRWGEGWPALPDSLRSLSLEAPPRGAWPDLPPSIRTLALYAVPPETERWPAWGSELRELTIELAPGGGDVHSLPEFPSQLRSLTLALAEHRELRSFPPLPGRLEVLWIGAGNLPELPPGLRELRLSAGSSLPAASQLPPALQRFFFDSGRMDIRDIPNLAALPLEEVTLDLRGSSWSELPGLPGSLRCLALQLEPGAPMTLSALPESIDRFILDVSGRYPGSASCRQKPE